MLLDILNWQEHGLARSGTTPRQGQSEETTHIKSTKSRALTVLLSASADRRLEGAETDERRACGYNSSNAFNPVVEHVYIPWLMWPTAYLTFNNYGAIICNYLQVLQEKQHGCLRCVPRHLGACNPQRQQPLRNLQQSKKEKTNMAAGCV
jgi:hypothetical protein